MSTPADLHPTPPATTSSAHDFDFIFGQWAVHNRKLVDIAHPDCDEWVEFDAVSEAFPVLGGTGHVDRIFAENPGAGVPPFEGFTLRLFDPAEGIWRIWWSSTRAPGVLDTPVTGRFTGGHGVFEARDTVGGQPVVVRFDWLADNPDKPCWQQWFSYDDEKTWKLTWTMRLTRTAGPQ